MTKNRVPLEEKTAVTPNFRVSWPSLITPKEPGKQAGSSDGGDSQRKRYSVTALFPKSTQLGKGVTVKKKSGDVTYPSLKKIVRNAIIDKWGADPEAWPKSVRPPYMPFSDGDEKDEAVDGYKDVFYATFWNHNPVGVLDERARLVTTDEVLYPGCWARAEIRAYGFDKNGNKGVTFSLQNIQKVGDDEPFTSRRKATETFDPITDDGEVEDDDEFEKEMAAAAKPVKQSKPASDEDDDDEPIVPKKKKPEKSWLDDDDDE